MVAPAKCTCGFVLVAGIVVLFATVPRQVERWQERERSRLALDFVCKARSTCPPFQNDADDAFLAQYRHGLVTYSNSPVWQDAATRIIAESAAAPLVDGRRREPLVLVLGPHMLETDAEEFKHLARLFPRVVLAEPNAGVLKGLRRNLMQYGIEDSRIKIADVAVCQKDGPATFFLPLQGEYAQAASLNTVALGENTRAVTVRCATPLSLLSELSIQASDVDVLSTDLEGVDLEVLEQLLVLDGFAPRLIKFEWFFAIIKDRLSGRSLVVRVVQDLSSRGYRVHQFGVAMIAVRE